MCNQFFVNILQMLLQNLDDKLYVSIDEAGMGSLAGPVVSCAVIWKAGPYDYLINDSKQLSKQKREDIVEYIKDNAIDYQISFVDNDTIDKVNIYNANMLSMHTCLDNLDVSFDHIMIDGNKFKKYGDIEHTCYVKGDATYVSIAAASILAKVARDEFMTQLHNEYEIYGFDKNKGYGTKEHIKNLKLHGPCPYHRRSYITNFM